jgi:uncharacterized protein YecE (DUF72 family)
MDADTDSVPSSALTVPDGRIVVGMGGWDIPSFDNVFYPPNPERGFRKLQYYAQFFDLVEINATFYAITFSPEQMHRWLDDVRENKNFLFTVKLFRGFTHTFDATEKDALKTQYLLESLKDGNRLGCLVAQFPNSYVRTKEHQEYFLKLQKAFGEFGLFIELRHRSWKNTDFEDFCTEKKLQIVSTDLPELPGFMPFHSPVRQKEQYFRMMGRNKEGWKTGGKSGRYDYDYTKEELDDLRSRILALQPNTRRTYVVFHNDTKINSLVNGLNLKRLLKPESRFPAPENLITKFPQLKEFCDPVGQLSLANGY